MERVSGLTRLQKDRVTLSGPRDSSDAPTKSVVALFKTSVSGLTRSFSHSQSITPTPDREGLAGFAGKEACAARVF